MTGTTTAAGSRAAGAAPTTAVAERPGFHPLQVVAVERLTDDAVAVSFAVPADLRATYAARPGQHVTVRAVLDGTEVRRTYSLCGEPGADVLTVGVKAVPDGVFSRFALDRLQVGDTLDVAPPGGSFGLDVDPARERHVAGDRRRQRHHPGPRHRPRGPGRRAGQPGHPAVRQPDGPRRDVRRGAVRPA